MSLNEHLCHLIYAQPILVRLIQTLIITLGIGRLFMIKFSVILFSKILKD